VKPVIICIDDDVEFLQSLRTELDQIFGDLFDYQLAQNSEEAFELLTELEYSGSTPVIILSDLMLGAERGHELLVRFHVRYPDAIKILMTGYPNSDAMKEAVETREIFGIVIKPWQRNDFRQLIHNAWKAWREKFPPSATEFAGSRASETISGFRIETQQDRKLITKLTTQPLTADFKMIPAERQSEDILIRIPPPNNNNDNSNNNTVESITMKNEGAPDWVRTTKKELPLPQEETRTVRGLSKGMIILLILFWVVLFYWLFFKL
jgi:response regulator RpfG family c-di-GMP phosphodiesterase